MRFACVFVVPDTEIPNLCKDIFPDLWAQGVQTVVVTNNETAEHDYAIELAETFEVFSRHAHCEAPVITDANSSIMKQLLISGTWFMVIASADASGTITAAIDGWRYNRPVIAYTTHNENTAKIWQRKFIREYKRIPTMGACSKTPTIAPPHVVISNNSNELKETINSFISHAAGRIGA